MNKSYFRNSLATMLICVLAVGALLISTLISVNESHAEGIWTGGDLVEGQAFTVTIDTQGEALRMGVPGGLNLQSGAQLDGGAIVVNGSATYTFTAAAGSYTLQLSGADGPVGSPVSFTVAPAPAPSPAPVSVAYAAEPETQAGQVAPAAAAPAQPEPEPPASSPPAQAAPEPTQADPPAEAEPEEPAEGSGDMDEAGEPQAGPEGPAEGEGQAGAQGEGQAGAQGEDVSDGADGAEEDGPEGLPEAEPAAVSAAGEESRDNDNGNNANVTFVVDGRTDSVQTVEKGKTAEPYVPEKKFWPAGAISFRGWYGNGAEETFDFNTPIVNDLKLYAQFSGNYLVKFLDAYGKVIAAYEYMPGEKVMAYKGTVSPPGTKELLYWYEQDDGPSVPFSFDTRTANKDMTLVPCFGNQYFVGYISAGSQVDSAIVSEGEKAPKPADPERKGYSFRHWSVTEGGDAFDFNTPVTEANTEGSVLTLYATWTPAMADYKVVYWFEKPNVSGDPGYGAGNYAFHSVESKQAEADTVVDYTAASASGLDGITVSDNDEKLGNINKRVGEFHHGEAKTVQGDGSTVVNVYYSRTVFTIAFDLPLGNNMASAWMKYGGNNYTNTAGGDNARYSFSAKYEQDIENAWPSSWNAEVGTVMKDGYREISFEGWHAEGMLYNSVTKRLALTPDLVPPPGSATRLMEAVWVTDVLEKEVEYWIEALPDEMDKAEAKAVRDEEEGLYVEGLYVKDERLSQRYRSTASLIVPKPLEGMESGVAFNNLQENYHELYYKRARYGLDFDSMGGTDALTNPGKDYGDIMYEESLSDYEPANPTKVLDGINYTFAGWYMDAEYFIPVDFETARMPHSDVELFARWEIEKKTVRFFSDIGGPSLGIDQSVEIGARASAPSGYVAGETVIEGKGVFNGWLFYLYPESNAGITRYSFDVPVTKDISIYANIRANGFKVTYDKGDGSGVAPTDPHPEGYSFNTMATAAGGSDIVPPSGRVFYGWRIQDDTSNRGLIQPGAAFSITGDMVLVAQYYNVNDTTTITFNGNGGTGSMASQTAIYGQDFTLAANAFTLSGHVFAGWNTRADGTGTSYSNGQAFTPWASRGGSIALYARWTPLSGNTYTVTVEDSYAAVSGAGSYTAGSNVTVSAGSRGGGYAFSGWTVVQGGISLANSATTGFVMPATNVTVRANWTQDTGTTYSVTYRPGAHGTFAAHTTSGLRYGDPTPTAPVATGETGWHFAGWSPAPRANVTGNAIYTAQWAEQDAERAVAVMHNVRFIDWDGRLIKTQQVPDGGSATPPPDPVRQGYIFNGWDRDYKNVKENIMVTALYIPNQTNTLVPIDPGNNPSTGEGAELGPFQAAGIPSIMLGSLEVPLWSGNLGHLAWGLTNLILCAIGVLLAAMAVVRAASQRRREREEASIVYYADGDGGPERQPGAGWIVTAIVMAIIGAIVFILTEDMGRIMVLVDNWTIISAIVFLMEVLALTQVFKRKLEDPDDMTPGATGMGETA